MNQEQLPDFAKINQELWNEKTETHWGSEFYSVKEFLTHKNSLKPIELQLLGNISGKSILHLQCHFGMDTLSLAHLGAEVTGVDLSDKSIEKAKELANMTGLNAEFICSNVYDLPKVLNKKYDIVFTSYGVIGWLPDMDKWANVVSHFLKPNGEFIMAEFHPVVWMFDYEFEKVEYSYFNKETIVEELEGTYADQNAPIKKKSVSWNHDLGEVLGALLKQGLSIKSFEEFDYSPFNCFNGTEEASDGNFIIKKHGRKLPLVYALKAKKDETKIGG